ncbi:galactose mutarotase [Thiospirochaeta perfilievii]|uniref:Aldose 1-epimerase n=1 Tax=Thiospirochaeta perfilievii TaxID=252967 RepID=A0A5C1Q6I3_9SPIO|nr:aldose epimerase family protein [Thiospirochaeta perfilievii]QEN03683.1 galactose mutarotase [Thiospirochaeta perfilievii]
MKINEFEFGKTNEGQTVMGTTISNSEIEFTVIDRGATLTSFKFKDRDNNLEECILGFDSIKEYEEHKAYYGATIGRVGNRIAKAQFTLDGTTYNLAVNNGTNCLHGGNVGFDKVIWNYSVFNNEDEAGVTFTYLSRDMEENFPGNLEVEVTYTLNKNSQFIINYKAVTDKKTPVNLTNHAYWNLSAFKESIHNHNMLIEADSYLTLDKDQIPTGELKSVENTPFNFKKLTKIGDNITKTGGYDHNFNLSLEKKDKPVNRMYIEHPKSGRAMEILTTEPGVQIYTGFEEHNFFCAETQMYPDAINNPKFESIVLNPGEVYRQKTIHNFSIKS